MTIDINNSADLRYLINRTLTKVYRTDLGKPSDLLPGLPLAYYFSVVIELDFKEKFLLGNDNISFWTDREDLFEITHKNWNLPLSLVFNNRKIKDISFNEMAAI